MLLFADAATESAGAAGGVLGIVVALLYAVDKIIAARARMRSDSIGAAKDEAEARISTADADDRAIKQHVELNRVLMKRTQRLQDQVDEQRSEVFAVRTELEAVKVGHQECEKRDAMRAEKIKHLEEVCDAQQRQIDRLVRLSPHPGVGTLTPPLSDSPPTG